MRTTLVTASWLLVGLTWVPSAHATTWYTSPTGTATCGCTTRENPCGLETAASGAIAGDTVILMDGVYTTHLYVKNSGTEDAWITFQADDCATPIIEGPGNGPMVDVQDTGVGSQEATYVRFVGLVARGWNIGFGNGWTGSGTTNSNGHWQIEHCVADGNGRTGFTFFSAQDFHLKNSISAHNGSSVLHSWSSGVTLYETSGGAVVEGTVSFENMDAQKHTDGSGFIADESSNDALFVNNIAFRNGGSCLRLTKSSGTKFVNNVCYHNAQDPMSTGPTNPSEVYFTENGSGTTKENVTFMNNVFVNTGQGPGMEAIYNQPDTGWMNNVVKTGMVDLFTAPEGDPPEFTLAASATDLIGKGGTGEHVPMGDIGFDPKCIKQGEPELVGDIAVAAWWQNSVDLDYIKSIGGVAQCFNSQARSGAPDIGAYVNGAVLALGECVPSAGDEAPPPPASEMVDGGSPLDCANVVPDASAPVSSGDPTTGPDMSGAPSSSAPVPTTTTTTTTGNPQPPMGAGGTGGVGTGAPADPSATTPATNTGAPATGTAGPSAVPSATGAPTQAPSGTGAAGATLDPLAPAVDSTANDDSSCGCRAVGGPAQSRTSLLTLLVGLALVTRARSRRGQHRA